MSSDLKTEEKPRWLWNRAEPGARRASLSREKIAEAAVRVADAEGFEAVSMRRVANELGAGTMTLYHYVMTKEELVSLMSDKVMGDLIVPDDELSADWREAITQIAHNTREIFRDHPWTIENTRSSSVGPNALRHFEQSLRAVEGTGGSPIERLDIVSMVDDYVFGFVMREVATKDWNTDDSEGFGPEGWSDDMIDFFEDQLATGEYPQISALRGEGTMEESLKRITAAAAGPDRFDRGLARLLGGIEAALEE